MINEGDRVQVPPYRSWDENDQQYMVTATENLTGTVGHMESLHTARGEDMPRTDYLCWVVLDKPIGIQDVVQYRASQLVKIE